MFHTATSFAPIETPDAVILILGSVPGLPSLDAQQYYAHPRNAFWPLIAQILDVPLPQDYKSKINLVKGHKIALWDVLHHCQRSGSLDNKIKNTDIKANDFETFFQNHPKIQSVYFNGAKAEAEFTKRVTPFLSEKYAKIRYLRLPSTSPAMAQMTREEKYQKWQILRPDLA